MNFNLKNLIYLIIVLILTENSFIQAELNVLIGKYLTKFVNEHHIPCLTAAGQHQSSIDGVKTNFQWASNGWSDVENRVTCSTDKLFRVASVSKAIGSGLIASLVESNKIHWDDDVNQLVPNYVFPTKTWNGKPVNITVRQLITHLSGLRSTTASDMMHDWEMRITNSTQTIALFANDPLLSKPGTMYHYSNCGWNLLGAIVEAVEKRSYNLVLNDYMQMLGMKVAESDTRLKLIPNKGSQYHLEKKGHGHVRLLPPPITDLTRPVPHWPCGAVLSNVDDLIIYGQEILNSYNNWPDHLLKSETIKSMWNYMPPETKRKNLTLTVNGVQYSNVTNHYVMGWERLDFPVETKDTLLSNLTMLYHIGEIGSANAILAIFPERNFIFGLVANIGGIGDLLPSVAVQVYYFYFANK
ncbi:hypothetical protein RDWZM_001641 [Blomia tropicalis]|uniref:Beta-lactamase-related domain-containing protein n=1 Tax=Blomia tropicalis TaxID=40697 RepID=A0A9Q0MC28_BLOTA|nr:hypothetical protein RDWZM_001641 [Blomia tropicalis]